MQTFSTVKQPTTPSPRYLGTTHTERGRSHAPIVVNPDDAVIVTFGDAQHCCAAESPANITPQHHYEADYHAWLRRACYASSPIFSGPILTSSSGAAEGPAL
jgi:hypothetical protein